MEVEDGGEGNVLRGGTLAAEVKPEPGALRSLLLSMGQQTRTLNAVITTLCLVRCQSKHCTGQRTEFIPAKHIQEAHKLEALNHLETSWEPEQDLTKKG